ncbi:hypothetical protein ACLKA6_011903 [Drosophila palustris]
MPIAAGQQRHAPRPLHHQSLHHQHKHHHQQQQQQQRTNTPNYNNKMLSSSHSSPREISASPRRAPLDTTVSGSTSGFGFSRGVFVDDAKWVGGGEVGGVGRVAWWRMCRIQHKFPPHAAPHPSLIIKFCQLRGEKEDAG